MYPAVGSTPFNRKMHGLTIQRHNIYAVYQMVDSLGQFEQIVLTAVLALGANAYGVTIHAKVEELSKPRKITRGAVYATLDRMENKGLITSWLSEPMPERGGRSRRHYLLEKSGQQALREAAKAARALYEAIAQSLGGLAWKPPC